MDYSSNDKSKLHWFHGIEFTWFIFIVPAHSIWSFSLLLDKIFNALANKYRKFLSWQMVLHAIDFLLDNLLSRYNRDIAFLKWPVQWGVHGSEKLGTQYHLSPPYISFRVLFRVLFVFPHDRYCRRRAGDFVGSTMKAMASFCRNQNSFNANKYTECLENNTLSSIFFPLFIVQLTCNQAFIFKYISN